MPSALSTEIRLAQRLVTLRQEKGWSLEKLADACAISRATLSRIERSETSPTASQLNQLCRVYGLTMSRLLSEVETPDNAHLSQEQQPLWQDKTSGFTRRNVSPPAAGFKAELIEGLLRSGAYIEYDQPPLPGIEQHIWMLAGVLLLTVEQRQWRLQAGDSLRFHLQGPGTFYAPDAEGAHYLLVVTR
ncbi:transcriptional regulator [Erwinia sp. OLTSP20]|uniref:helix-turn-helix domain-containing protein n=1 Tax=unclassified Erwinia TaxID=2622719 RepID=UPI000C181338|nr:MULTISPECIES: XRE family transcriptional regulator [unclassified Erwinia]PIJ48696.1 transcriptional regulator [Erwinia sp. OAMSP11]PIJ69320.1 transcriptional regulator [Erwinia sp. OLSSP12]PIJ79154.1 transcriptional regulator [Erwinia sp. OLCASP19]PIJ80680.1 transcriptional regulator [Erwinia sp. OLMTSP26]PIJ82830.1 transcriptional regulator [Erwinia sp. OLMDSP33]